MISSLLLSINILTEVIGERIFLGFATFPTFADWLKGIVLMLVYSLIALPFGWWSNFLQLDLQFFRKFAIRIIATSLIAPAILEELFFRVILLPCATENMNLKNVLIWSAISLVLFIIYHPLNGITFFSAGRETFFDPVFLCLATFLGLICTVAYLQSGSIWIPVSIHWLTVVIWLLFLGGINKLKLVKVKNNCDP